MCRHRVQNCQEFCYFPRTNLSVRPKLAARLISSMEMILIGLSKSYQTPNRWEQIKEKPKIAFTFFDMLQANHYYKRKTLTFLYIEMKENSTFYIIFGRTDIICKFHWFSLLFRSKKLVCLRVSTLTSKLGAFIFVFQLFVTFSS